MSEFEVEGLIPWLVLISIAGAIGLLGYLFKKFFGMQGIANIIGRILYNLKYSSGNLVSPALALVAYSIAMFLLDVSTPWLFKLIPTSAFWLGFAVFPIVAYLAARKEKVAKIAWIIFLLIYLFPFLTLVPVVIDEVKDSLGFNAPPKNPTSKTSGYEILERGKREYADIKYGIGLAGKADVVGCVYRQHLRGNLLNGAHEQRLIVEDVFCPDKTVTAEMLERVKRLPKPVALPELLNGENLVRYTLIEGEGSATIDWKLWPR